MQKPKIYCKEGDCFNCPYDDCIGTIRKKRGRKPLSPEERRRRRNERSKEYYRLHRDELLVKKKEWYQNKKNETTS